MQVFILFQINGSKADCDKCAQRTDYVTESREIFQVLSDAEEEAVREIQSCKSDLYVTWLFSASLAVDYLIIENIYKQLVHIELYKKILSLSIPIDSHFVHA